jgi:hypothetical protein
MRYGDAVSWRALAGEINRRQGRVLALAAWVASGCGVGTAEPPATDEGGDDETGGQADPGEPDPQFVVDCEDAPFMRTGTSQSTLAFIEGVGDGSCGQGGPVVYAALRPEIRADVIIESSGAEYEPRVALLDAVCEPEAEPLACAKGVPLVLADIAAGTELRLAVGIDSDDPALADEAPVAALAFRVDYVLRPVWAAGELCTGLGRCEAGTACVESPEGVPRCTALAADTCASAEAVMLPPVVGEEAMLTIPADARHTDAHTHSCTGDRTAERVLRLRLSGALPGGAAVEISSDDPGASLAVRVGGCEPQAEVGCAAPAETDPPGPPPTVRVDAAAFVDPAFPQEISDAWVFLERPEVVPGSPNPAVSVRIRVVDA